jgi:hypothetical protein
MTHEIAREKLVDLAYGELSRREARAVEAHAERCDACRAALAQMTDTRRLMSALRPEAAPERGESILLAAAREAARARARPRRVLPPWLWAGSVAAVALLAVGALSYRLLTLRPVGQEDPDALMGRPDTYVSREAAAPTPADAEAGAPADAEAGAPADAEAGAPAARQERRADPRLRDVQREPAPRAPSREVPSLPREAGNPSTLQGAPRPAPLGARGPGGVREEAPPSPSAPSSSANDAARAPQRAAPASPAPSEEVAPLAMREEAAPSPSAGADARAQQRAAPASPGPSEELPPLPRGAEERAGVRGPAPEAPSSRFAAPPSAAKRAAGPPPAEAPPTATAVARYRALRAQGALRGEVVTFQDCPGERWRKVETDGAGRVVRYARNGVTDAGAAFEAELYYGEDGVLAAVRYREGDGPSRETTAGPGFADAGIPAAVLAPRAAAQASAAAPPRCE